MYIDVAPALVIVSIGGIDFRTLNIDEEHIIFESADLIEDKLPIVIRIFDYFKGSYDKFIINDYQIINCEKRAFSFVYTVYIQINNGYTIAEYCNKLRNVDKVITYYNQFSSNTDNEKEGLIEDLNMDSQKEDNAYYDNYSEMMKDWFDYCREGHDYEAFSKLLLKVEIAFLINSPKLYSQFIENGIGESIKNNLIELGLHEHGLFFGKFSRVYIGNEFCPNLFPSLGDLFSLLDKSIEEKFSVTICFSYLIERYVEKTLDVLAKINEWGIEHGMVLEVVVNDLGMINKIFKEFSNLEPILGRLMNKRKKDPRILKCLEYERHKHGIRQNNLNSKHAIKELSDYGIKRFEFDSNISGNEIPCGHHSLHFPFYQITTSPFCTLNSVCTLNKQKLADGCPYYCDEFYLEYSKQHNMIHRGNSIFGINQSILKEPHIINEYCNSGAIDRLVIAVR